MLNYPFCVQAWQIFSPHHCFHPGRQNTPDNFCCSFPGLIGAVFSLDDSTNVDISVSCLNLEKPIVIHVSFLFQVKRRKFHSLSYS